MMADRDELLQREADGWAALLDAVDRVPDELRTVEGVVPGWSVVDLVFHCGKWSELAGTHLEEIAAGLSQDLFLHRLEGVTELQVGDVIMIFHSSAQQDIADFIKTDL